MMRRWMAPPPQGFRDVTLKIYRNDTARNRATVCVLPASNERRCLNNYGKLAVTRPSNLGFEKRRKCSPRRHPDSVVLSRSET